jgi:hypothetical protein
MAFGSRRAARRLAEAAAIVAATGSPDDTAHTSDPLHRARPDRHGLVPDDVVTADPVVGAEEAAVRAAALRGDWRPAARTLHRIGQNWESRAIWVRALATIAANEDGWLREWRAAEPKSPDAAVVHADSLVTLAWQVRSTERAEHVSSEQFATFFRILEEAVQACRAAVALAPADPTPWATLLAVAKGLQWDAIAFEQVWTELVNRAPTHRAGHDRALSYWCAKWLGSHEKMFEFAWQAGEKAPVLAVLPLVAAFEYWAQEGSPSMFAEPRMQAAADTVRAGWLELAGRDSHYAQHDRAMVATTLTFGGRGEEGLAEFRILGTRADAGRWHYFPPAPHKFLQLRRLACLQSEITEPGRHVSADADRHSDVNPHSR